MDRIEDCISFIVGKTAQQVTRRARELLAPFGVTPVQYAVLKVVCDAEALSGVDIAQFWTGAAQPRTPPGSVPHPSSRFCR